MVTNASSNMITRVEGGLTYTQTFDAENRLISVTVSGQETEFIYDGDGNPSTGSGQACEKGQP